ncbi:hypothetical protein DRO61_01620 [Candidatus Bathyarchaeota archaeon]|nr:MAG: hypothetical protein DRO61_01620 [Candidatus Bathyarchaeota archaeon]
MKIRLRETVEEPEKHSLWWVQTFSEIQNKVLDVIQSQKLIKEKLLMELFKSNPVPTWKLQGETWTILNGSIITTQIEVYSQMNRENLR